MKFIKIFCSFKVALPLMLLYALACAVATFVENDFGTPAAKFLIYGAWWFDILHGLLTLSLIGIFATSKAWKNKNYASLLFHASFVVIVLGAGITRYFGFEGVMHIREGSASDTIITQEEYLTLHIRSNEHSQTLHIPVLFSAISMSEIHTQIPLGSDTLSIDTHQYTPSNSSNTSSYPTLKLALSLNGISKELELSQSFLQIPHENIALFKEASIQVIWGPKEVKVPFSLYLKRFELDRYAGSMSPSSYASEIIIRDPRTNLIKPFRIFMNNVLDYDGYRFFQSSYDEDEKGTILSVNNDPGKIPTYIGYAMLIIGFLWNFFEKNSRFAALGRYLREQKLFVLPLLLSLSIFVPNPSFGYANMGEVDSEHTPKIDMHGSNSSMGSTIKGMPHPTIIDAGDDISGDTSEEDSPIQAHTTTSSVVTPDATPEDIAILIHNMKNKMDAHSKKLGEMMIQDFGGRMRPLDTHAMDLIHKITKKDGFLGLNNTELFLGMLMYPYAFQKIKMFATQTPKLREILGTPLDEKYVAFEDFYDENTFKLGNYIEEANRKKPAQRDTFDKDLLALSERINVAYVIYTAQALVIFPNKADGGKEWLSPPDAVVSLSREDSIQIQQMLQDYFSHVDMALESNNWSEADKYLEVLKDYQKQYGAVIMPPKSRIDMEILLNHYNPFKNLIYAYLILGIVFFIAVLISILKNKPLSPLVAKSGYAIALILALLHTLALGLRWYVGDHAPWSNAYESMVYIAWAGIVSGVVFFRKSSLALSVASLLAGITLFVAHLGFMDPQIGNLVPVLKSYWLNIHVSVITASYGFLGLCFMLGVISLLLFMLRTPTRAHIDQSILNIHCINEMSMMLGLALLTIGNFLGGVWANESWGRYWGWDSKETWALISIVVYAVILHTRFVKSLNSPYAFAVMSVVGFYSILMTYFGVNFYLSGMHSYAAGDPVPVPPFLYVMVALSILLCLAPLKKRHLSMPQPLTKHSPLSPKS